MQGFANQAGRTGAFQCAKMAAEKQFCLPKLVEQEDGDEKDNSFLDNSYWTNRNCG